MSISNKHRTLIDIVKDINEVDIKNTKKFGALADELCKVVIKKQTLKNRLSNPKETSERIRNILNIIAVIPDDIKQMIWLKKLAFEYDLSEKLLLKELEIIRGKKHQQAERREKRKKKYDRKK